jgi:hypothetical protein
MAMTRRLPGIEGWCEPDRLDLQPSLSDFVFCCDWLPTTRLTGQKRGESRLQAHVHATVPCGRSWSIAVCPASRVPIVRRRMAPDPHAAYV